MKAHDFFVDKGDHLVSAPVYSIECNNGKVHMERQQMKIKNGQITTREPYRGNTALLRLRGLLTAICTGLCWVRLPNKEHMI